MSVCYVMAALRGCCRQLLTLAVVKDNSGNTPPGTIELIATKVDLQGLNHAWTIAWEIDF